MPHVAPPLRHTSGPGRLPARRVTKQCRASQAAVNSFYALVRWRPSILSKPIPRVRHLHCSESYGDKPFSVYTGFDRVDYSDRTGNVSVTRDDQPNDGEPGEGDNVHSDTEPP